MSLYARIKQDGSFDRLVELTADQYAALQANGKAAYLRQWVVDPQPVPEPSQVVVDAGIVVGPVEAHQTWSLRAKTQAELGADANAADRSTLLSLITALTTDIDAYNANPDVTGTTAERLAKLEARAKELERQQRRDNRLLRYYLRSQP